MKSVLVALVVASVVEEALEVMQQLLEEALESMQQILEEIKEVVEMGIVCLRKFFW